MKKKIQRVVCALLLIGVLCSQTACRSTKKGDSSSQSQLSSENVSSGASSQDAESSSGASSGDASNAGNSSSKVTSAASNTSSNGASSASTTASKPAAISASGSWQQVLKSLPKNLRGTKIEVFHWNPVTELQGGAKILSNFEKQTGMKVKWTVASYDNYDVELQARVAAGNSPDIVLFQWMNANRAKLCQPVSNSGFNFNNSDWDSEALKYYTVKGKTYAVNMKGTLLNRPDVFFYNKSLIEKYDFEDPYTLWKQGKWTDTKFMEMCKEFNRQVNGPAWVVSKFDIWALLSGLQCELSYKDGKYGNNLRNSGAVVAWQRCADVYQSNLVDKSWDSDGFEANKYLFMDTSLMYTRTTQPYFANMKSGGTLGVVPYFKMSGQSTQYTVMGEYEAYGIAKGAKNLAGAPFFLRYYLDPATYNEKSFFCSEQALEVYKYCMSQPNRIMHNRYPLGSGNSTSPVQDVRLAFEGATSAQIPTVINTYASKVDSCVKNLNDKLNALS